MSRVLLLLPVAGYAGEDYAAAADRLNIELIVCADYCHRLAPSWGLPPLMSVPFDQPELALPQVLNQLKGPVNAVLAVDDHGLALAACLRERLGLPGNSPHAVMQLADKLMFRQLQQGIVLPHPAFYWLRHDDELHAAASAVHFPLVVKARRLNASRGVIRADNADELHAAVHTVRRIQSRLQRDADNLGLLVEAFIPGEEVALEGVLQGGALRVLAVFDKPDPLNGPNFEERRYVTPSRLPDPVQSAIAEDVSLACAAAGVTEGPIHAEARINDQGVWLLEIAPRAIGGLCGRVLQAAVGMDATELVLRHATGLPLPDVAQQADAAGVMMIPIPATGILKSVEGIEAARDIPYISGIEITARNGQLIAPPPEGASYLGFIFSRAPSPEAAGNALLAAHSQLVIHIQATFP
ncbi:MAG: ATP-grasp domain-containing protein [Thiobacillaceae bacterium]